MITAGTIGGNVFTIKGDSTLTTQGTDLVNVIGATAKVTSSGRGASVSETNSTVIFKATGGTTDQTVTVSGGAATVAGGPTANAITTASSGRLDRQPRHWNPSGAENGPDTISAGNATAIVTSRVPHPSPAAWVLCK